MAESQKERCDAGMDQSNLSVVEDSTVWAQVGEKFFARSKASEVGKLLPGVYNYQENMVAWWLEKEGERFEFPFKVYSASDHIIERVCAYWKINGGNLGVLMNGIRGAGKTMTAQLIGNRLVEDMGVPVLVVREPVPLKKVLDSLEQPVLVIFDEFEKTHEKEDQQTLLSTVDGMSRSVYPRLFLFTTNTRDIEENFTDRPSRIHYRFEFQRVADEIIEGLMDDSLPEDLQQYRSDISHYLKTRKICTIDIVKAVIAEVVTFREPPTDFGEYLNISEGEPPAYRVTILNPETNEPVQVFREQFSPRNILPEFQGLFEENTRAVETLQHRPNGCRVCDFAIDGTYVINVLQKTEEEGCWLAQISVPRTKTFFKEFPFLEPGSVFLDEKPEDWSFPYTREIVEQDSEAKEKVEQIWDESLMQDTLYGTGKPTTFKIKVEPDHEASVYSRWRPSMDVSGWG